MNGEVKLLAVLDADSRKCYLIPYALLQVMLSILVSVVSLGQVADVSAGETCEQLYFYVDASREDDSGDGHTWVTAKKTIQAAVDIAPAGATVWVTNGIYTPSPEVIITNDITVSSVNGPEVTIVMGGDAWEPSRLHGCFRLGDCMASVRGFTIRDGRGAWDNVPWSLGEGGGVYCVGTRPTVVQCILTRNSAEFGAAMFGGTAIDCMFSNNSASDTGSGGAMCGGNAIRCTFLDNKASFGGGGGMLGGTAINCLFSGNIASGGGGMADGIAVNCTFSGNIAPASEAMWGGMASNSIAWPDSFHDGTVLNSCWTNDPHFVDVAGRDFHLQSTSPCIDAGNSDTAHDLDGLPRPLDGDADGIAIIDIGCYEYLNHAADSDGDMMPDGFEVTHGLDPTDASDAAKNLDGDPVNNRDEYIADTCVTNANDYFRIIAADIGTPITFHFLSSSNRFYTLHICSDLTADTWTNVPETGPRRGSGFQDSMTDTNMHTGNRFYRIKVELP